MEFFKKISDMFGLNDPDDFDDEIEEDEESGNAEDSNSVFVSKNKSGGRKSGNNVVNINATTQLEVVLVKPERFDDASSIADHLNNKRTVVLNLESTNKEVSRRLVDYANSGQIKRVANSTFIITPYNVGIMGDLLDELENSGVYF
ncbi:MAG: cell division protein SepF [Oscillospiraceae bacterium]